MDTLRRFWPRGGELMRTSDRIEGAVLALVLLAATVLLPVTLAIGSEVYINGTRLAEQQGADRHPAIAILTEPAPVRTPTVHSGMASQTSDVAARWELPGGGIRTGTVPVTNGSPAGTQVPIWLDTNGNVVHRPATEAGAAGAAIITVIAVWGAAVGLLAGLFLAVRAGLDRYRLAAWQRAWELVEPEWKHRAG